jgi:hypothetical protein
MVDMATAGSEMTREIGDVELIGADQPHKELLAALGSERDILAKILEELRGSQPVTEILILNGGVVSQSQYPKLRVKQILIAFAGATTFGDLVIGNMRYTLATGSGMTGVSLPLLIERGVDISWSLAASVMYVIGTVE